MEKSNRIEACDLNFVISLTSTLHYLLCFSIGLHNTEIGIASERKRASSWRWKPRSTLCITQLLERIFFLLWKQLGLGLPALALTRHHVLVLFLPFETIRSSNPPMILGYLSLASGTEVIFSSWSIHPSTVCVRSDVGVEQEHACLTGSELVTRFHQASL